MIGQTLSHYKIIEKLGAGGQGEVYLAEDSRLDRKVALKILPQHLSDRADLRERFEREARAVSSLNHPHICGLYDIGEQDGIHYLVMEHLEGETLAARLEKGALPLEQTLQYAIQIADALDKAHRQGVVHRDLKPGNIMLVKSGAKLLDFGLAKLQATETPTNLSALPTEQASLTAEGTILGTLQYMAPEQLEGKEADSRTDIFAFGAVVYEMATGKKAFEGGSQASLISAIMKDDPRPMTELQPMTPSVLDWVVRRCLAKEPDNRVQTAADLMAELRWVTESRTEAGLPHPAAPLVGRSWMTMASLLVLGGVVGGTAVWSLLTTSSPVSNFPSEFVITTTLTERLANGPGNDVSISPDGEVILYVGQSGTSSQIYMRHMGDLSAKTIPGTEGASDPIFSPDGQSLAFFTGNELKKVSLTGGPAITLCDVCPASAIRGGSWGLDDVIIFGRRRQGLSQIPVAGGTPQFLTTTDSPTGEGHRWPEFLPGGKALLFTIRRSDTDDIAVLDLETGQSRIVLEGGRQARYTPTGHLVYEQSRTGALMAALFDVEKLEVISDPVSILGGVRQNPLVAVDYGLSQNGTLVYVPTEGNLDRTLIWVDRQGESRLVTDTRGGFNWPRFSPDGDRLAVTIIDEQDYKIWVHEIDRGILSPLGFEGDHRAGIWASDGMRLAFALRSPQGFDIFWMPVDGSSKAEQLTQSTDVQTPTSWHPDGAILLQRRGRETGYDILELPEGSESTPQPLLSTPSEETQAMFSPDGRWIAFTSNRSGRDEVYVKPYPGEGGIVPISADGGSQPVWGRDGTELFYRNGDKMMVVPVQKEPTFKAQAPRLLFEGSYSDGYSGLVSNYDVSPDGQRFVMVTEAEGETFPQIRVVLNWFEELKRLAPTN